MIELYETLYYSELENRDILLDYINLIQRMKKILEILSQLDLSMIERFDYQKFLEYRCDNNLEAHPDEKVWEDIIKIQKEMLYITFELKKDFKGIYSLYQKSENDDQNRENWFSTMPFNTMVDKSLKELL